MRPWTLLIVLTLTFACNVFADEPEKQLPSTDPPSTRLPATWWKGNLHTHSLWSDGDQFPEMIADWYRERGYHFLALTDHNVLSEGMRWMPMAKIIERSDAGILDRYRQRFGEDWVETTGETGEKDHQVRLKPLDEFRYLLEQSGKFILIPAEEISDKSEGKPVHINATNVAEALQPVGGDTVRETIENNLRAILEHEKSHGREVLPHVNHPNFGYAITAEDLAAVISEQFFEVYNGHPGVNQLGDDDHPSIERMWDLINAIRQNSLNIPPMMGIATDDSHEYHGKPGSRPGRGWVMVRSRYLTPEHLIRAMKRGDFYASSGVSLTDVRFDDSTKTLAIEIDAQPGVTYRTDFIASLANQSSEDGKESESIDEHRIGVVVATSDQTSAKYTMTGKELYLRAVVTSSEPPKDPSFTGQKQQAWTQPVGWRELR
ncbi:CehA/McbA family metallohydrolase domain-containing protein [Rubripirellula reticaptiva]|uniref:PHP domain protein n=1 Tax=Rubripirellula reticaptiva TaxID=2528013 RepID=A0A5C6ERP0_9BACT|nr:hypothetical protein [Rubripirellula reticaptiva]TWU51618.1 PHP domain protein [Rubripirellula reticaptiva]